MSWRYLRTADRLITNNVSNIKIFRPNGTNITLFFAASIAAFCSIPRLKDATESRAAVPDNGAGDVNSSSSTKQKEVIPIGPGKECPRYGCPLLPRDMYFDEEAQAALKAIRSLHEQYGSRSSTSSSTSTASGTSTSLTNDESDGSEAVLMLNRTKALELLKTAGGQDQATLTLIGYKGGNIEDQVNQDRAFVVSQFHTEDDDYSDSDSSYGSDASNRLRTPKRLLGVFDGHSNLGELVSQYSVTHLPEALSSKLGPILSSSLSADGESERIQQAIVEAFVEIDKNAPAELSGGCTASIVLQIGQKNIHR